MTTTNGGTARLGPARRTGRLGLAALLGLATLLTPALAGAAPAAAPDAGAAAGTTSGAGPGSGRPRSGPVPVSSAPMADPGLVTDGHRFVAYTTGTDVQVSSAPTAAGPWSAPTAALSSFPAWMAPGAHGIWAPDAVRTGTGWVLYFAGIANVPNGVQTNHRCIGTATSSSATGPFTPAATPLVCPDLGAPDPVDGAPVPGVGVIDPSPGYLTVGGQRGLYLVYKTQQTPSSLRMVELAADGQHVRGASRELVRSTGIVENPVIVQRGSAYVLLFSRFGFDNCSYQTQWLRGTDPWTWDLTAARSLMSTDATGLCGPGGADVVPAQVPDQDRVFFHAWVCTIDGTEQPCDDGTVGQAAYQPARKMYARVLTWGDDGQTPTVGDYLAPVGPARSGR